MKKINLLLAFTLILLGQSLFAQSVSRVGTTAAPFLKIGVGARLIGMGEAGVTEAEDIYAMYWNPAGLARMQGSQIALNHFEWIADIAFEYAGFAVSLPGVGAFGVNVTSWGAGEIERTTLFEQEGTGEMVSMGSICFGATFARNLTDRFSFGLNGKYIRETLWHSHATGFALDAGVLFNTQFYNMKIGASISNYGSKMQMRGQDMLVQHDIDPVNDGNNENVNAYLSTEAYNLPIFFRFGISMNILEDLFGVENQDLNLAVNVIHPNDNKQYVNVGGEYRFRELIALRGGYRQLFLDYAEGGMTAGFGLFQRLGSVGLGLDYAAMDYGRLDIVHKFSLALAF